MNVNHDIHCQLDCIQSTSCSNILYTCGNINDYNRLNETTTCAINCLSSNSSTNLTVMSTSGKTYINCNTPNSCQHSNCICNPSYEITTLTPTECTLDCTKQSCSQINYCTGYTFKCTPECNDIQSCNSLVMICDQYINISDTNTQMQCDLLCKQSNDMLSKLTRMEGDIFKSGDAFKCDRNQYIMVKFCNVYTGTPPSPNDKYVDDIKDGFIISTSNITLKR